MPTGRKTNILLKKTRSGCSGATTEFVLEPTQPAGASCSRCRIRSTMDIFLRVLLLRDHRPRVLLPRDHRPRVLLLRDHLGGLRGEILLLRLLKKDPMQEMEQSAFCDPLTRAWMCRIQPPVVHLLCRSTLPRQALQILLASEQASHQATKVSK